VAGVTWFDEDKSTGQCAMQVSHWWPMFHFGDNKGVSKVMRMSFQKITVLVIVIFLQQFERCHQYNSKSTEDRRILHKV